MTRVWRFLVARIVIYRNQRRAVTIAVIGIKPPVAHVLRAGRAHLAEENCFRQPIGDRLQTLSSADASKWSCKDSRIIDWSREARRRFKQLRIAHAVRIEPHLCWTTGGGVVMSD